MAGVVGGILNSVAGGGSFITFPALMWAGIPPIAANATNTFASCAGYLSGAYGFRHDIREDKRAIKQIVICSLIGSMLGAYLLLHTPEQRFMEAIPWLMLFATVLFVFGQTLHLWISKHAAQHQQAGRWGAVLLTLLLLIVAIYGGFFNAGLGIIGLSYLALAGYQNINLMNGLKLLISSSVSLVAIVIFVVEDSIDWTSGLVVMAGTLVGGYYAARISRAIPQQYVRHFVTLISVLITLYFFWDVYG